MQAARAIAPQARVCAYGHVCDGNLHFQLPAPPGQSLEAFVAAHARRSRARCMARSCSSGGSVCAEHGVGQTKRELLERYSIPSASRFMRTLKGGARSGRPDEPRQGSVTPFNSGREAPAARTRTTPPMQERRQPTAYKV
jgi:hypothetical protein